MDDEACAILRNRDVIKQAYFRSRWQVAHLRFRISMVNLVRICNKTQGWGLLKTSYALLLLLLLSACKAIAGRWPPQSFPLATPYTFFKLQRGASMMGWVEGHPQMFIGGQTASGFAPQLPSISCLLNGICVPALVDTGSLKSCVSKDV